MFSTISIDFRPQRCVYEALKLISTRNTQVTLKLLDDGTITLSAPMVDMCFELDD